jgi:Glucose-6-phosphate dehydrogenase, NAD binding domain
MSEQRYDFFGEIFRRYFRPAIDAYPGTGEALVERLFTLTDEVSDRLTPSRGAAISWGRAETPNARITSEGFVITQHGLLYAAGLNESRRALYYLATPPALFDAFVDQVDTAALQTAALQGGAVVAVDCRSGRDLAAAHPMDAALSRILDEHLALRVDLHRFGV